MKQVRIILWVAVAIAAVLAGILFLNSRQQQPVTRSVAQGSLGGPFTLVGADGQPFSSARLAGKPYAIFFGFTHCPDVCPTTLARLVKLRNQLGRGDAAFNIVFVSVDPKRDGPKDVGAYSAAFNAPVIGLTGSPAQIERVKKQFGIFSQETSDGSGGYTVDHTATTLLFDESGKLAGTIAADEADGPALDKLKLLTA
jgi:protein SCO1/2